MLVPFLSRKHVSSRRLPLAKTHFHISVKESEIRILAKSFPHTSCAIEVATKRVGPSAGRNDRSHNIRSALHQPARQGCFLLLLLLFPVVLCARPTSGCRNASSKLVILCCPQIGDKIMRKSVCRGLPGKLAERAGDAFEVVGAGELSDAGGGRRGIDLDGNERHRRTGSPLPAR